MKAFPLIPPQPRYNHLMTQANHEMPMLFSKVPFKVRVYETLRRLYNKRYAYISTKRLVEEMQTGYFRVYRALKSLEADGTVQRKSRQSGWRPTLLGAAVYGGLLIKYRRSHNFIPSADIALHLNHNPRTIRAELAVLERAGIVHRQGTRGGWKPTRNQVKTVDLAIVDTVHKLHHRTRQHIDTNTIAAQLNITPRHARRLLTHYEQQGILTRSGQRGGWKPTYARAG